jgi:hypothetical protein
MICRLDSASGIDHHVLGFQISIDDVPFALATMCFSILLQYLVGIPNFYKFIPLLLSYQTVSNPQLVVQMISPISGQKHGQTTNPPWLLS